MPSSGFPLLSFLSGRLSERILWPPRGKITPNYRLYLLMSSKEFIFKIFCKSHLLIGQTAMYLAITGKLVENVKPWCLSHADVVNIFLVITVALSWQGHLSEGIREIWV